jgi:cytoskeleton-associated protein 5
VISGPFSHADKNVRSEATALVVELNKWLGISVLNLLNGLKPVQMKELQELCSQIPSFSPTPTRYLRSQKPVHIPEESKAMDTAEDYSREDAPVSLPSQVSQTAISGPVPIMDAYDLADSVDVNTKLPQNLYEMLGSSSWKDRKEALETVLPLIKVPKICDNGRYGEFIDAICKRIGDVNVLVVILAAGCVEAMATGLRSNFGPYRSSVVSALLEKAKEKKQNVVDAIRSALDSLRFCIQQLNENFLEEVSPFIVHKNPSVRSESLLWLSRLMQSMHQVPSKKDCRSIVEAVIPAMDDGTTEVREASAVCLAWIQKFLGEAGVAPFFEKLDKIKLNKVKELSEKIHPAGKPSPSYKIAPAVKVAPTRPVPALPVPAPQANRKIPAESQLTSESASKSRKMDIDEFSFSLSFSHSDEEAIRFFSEWFGEALCTELSDSVWKTRLTAIEQIYSKIDEASELPLGFSTELLTRFFSQKPSWKDSNFQVLGKVISCLIRAAKHQFYTREAASLAINGLVEKLSDPKLRNDCGELFLILAEQVPVGFVLMQVSGLARSQKSPKIQADIVKWLQSAVQAFGISGVQVQDLISICKLCLGNSNPTVRSVAIALAGTLRAFVGPDLRLLFNDVSTSLLAALDAEFNRIASEPAPVCSRQSLSRPMATSAPSVNATSNDIVEDLIPRTNITALINESLLAKLSDVSWKVRKSGLDEVTQILASANYRVKYTGYELFNSLKARLSDSNKNLSLQALEICGAVAEAMGSVFEKHLKTLLPPVLETLSDNKVQVRQAALKALDRFLLVSPISTFFSLIGLALIPDSPNTRKELLTWTAGVLSQQKQGSVIKEELLEIVGSIAGCLQDRSVEVRKAAQIMVSAMIEHVTVESLKKACSDQQPRSITSLLPLLEAARKTINSSSAPVPAIVTSHPNFVPQSAPRTPQRAMSVRHNRPITPINPSASLQNLNDEVSKNPMDEFPLLTSDISGKSMRAEKDKGSARWSFDTPRKDIIDFLREQMLGNVSYSLVGKLFSDDFRDHIAAMNRFEEFINLASDDETKAKYVANLDLILKYLTLRFFDTNTSVLIKSLELTESIVSFMDNCNYRLSEYEASAFFPFLILKVIII